MRVVELRGLKPGWLLYYIVGIYHLKKKNLVKNIFKKKIRNNENLWTEARMDDSFIIYLESII